jgi:hypothetical protein
MSGLPVFFRHRSENLRSKLLPDAENLYFYFAMSEDFLHYIWKFGLFDKNNLRTLSGDVLEVLKPGEHNFDSGPDFFNAQIRMNGTLLAGNVEIHTNSSDWYKHKHEKDKAYNSVILHVVLTSDAENYLLRPQAKNAKGDTVPELELKFRILPGVLKNYEQLKKSTRSFPCAGMIKKAERSVVDMWLERMLIERLEEKQEIVRSIFESTNKDWQETLYRLLAKNFGFKTNADAFYRLAQSLPLTILLRHKNDLFQLESLLFGQSGLLDEHFEDPYIRKLQNEYAFLKKKYSLVPLAKENWKYLRMRPVNFPTIRIAQFAALIYDSTYLFSKIIDGASAEYIKEFFTATASSFWDTHYSFATTSAETRKVIGNEARENILINTVAPLLFFYGKQRSDEEQVNRAVELLSAVAAEDNKITREYVKAGVKPENALQSQGMMQLHKYYCSQSGCLKCSIGNKLLRD